VLRTLLCGRLTVLPETLFTECMQAAIVAAARYGGDTDTLACMTGALAGALHGPAWLPQDWCKRHVEELARD
jgi:ADP-ribosylglycohydrolase